MRFETNAAITFYQALAVRLAEILDQSLTQPSSDPAYYRERAIQYLDLLRESKRRCLIVIDGLDETMGWHINPSVLPLDPAQSLRIVAAARILAGDRGSADWFHRLGWDRHSDLATAWEVPLLDRDGLEEVVASMGNSLVDLPNNAEVLSELLHLTKGEPLLAELYVKAMLEQPDQSARLTVADLRGLQPGYPGFFKSWWEQQLYAWSQGAAIVDPRIIEAALAILACALGPLKLAEFASLMKAVHGIDRIISADTLRPVQRFVIGDGVKAGYLFSHPKLADYFRDEHFGGGEVIRRTRLGMVDWAAATVRTLNQGALDPSSDVDHGYLLKHYAQHLACENAAPNRFIELVEDGWRRAWERLEGVDAGFALDVLTARDVLRAYGSDTVRLHESGIGLGGQIRCALSLSSISTTNSTIPSELLALCLRYGVLSEVQALAAVDLNPSATWKAEVFVKLVPYLGTDNLAGYVPAIFDGLREDDQKWFMSGVDAALSIKQRAEILDLLPMLRSEDFRALLIMSCAPYLAASKAARAAAIARDIGHPAWRTWALLELALESDLAPPEAESLLNEALAASLLASETTARTFRLNLAARRPVSSPNDTSSILADILADLRGGSGMTSTAIKLALHQPDELSIVAAEALATLANSRENRSTLIRLVPILPMERLEEALALARCVSDSTEERAELLAALAVRVVDQNPSAPAEAVLAACSLKMAATRDRILTGLKPHLTGATRATTVAACKELAIAGGETLCSARVFAFIGSLLDPPERSEHVGRALTIARALSFDWQAARKASLRDWERTFDERPGRAQVLADILSLIPPEERGAIMDEALAATRAIGTSHSDERAETFTALAHLVSENERVPIVAEAIAAAHRIDDEYYKKKALVQLAPVLSLSHGSEAIAAAATIDSIPLRASALEALAPRLLKQDVVVGLMECLAGARTLDDGELRNRAVNALSRFIPGMERSPSNGEQDLDEWSESANADTKPLSEKHLAVVTSLADQVLAEASSGEVDGDDQRLGVLISTIPKLPERIYQSAVNALLQATRTFKNEAAKRAILVEIAGQLRDDFAVEAMKIALTIIAPYDRAETLAALVSRLPDRESSSAFAEILDVSPRIRRGLLLLALAKSAAAIHRIGGVNAVRGTVDAIRDVGRWWP
jgi:hypothetical protein